MSDIVERLRGSLLLGNDPKLHLLRNSDIAEAANEIEWLRTQLRQIELNSREGEPLTLKLNWLARRALEGK